MVISTNLITSETLFSTEQTKAGGEIGKRENQFAYISWRTVRMIDIKTLIMQSAARTFLLNCICC